MSNPSEHPEIEKLRGVIARDPGPWDEARKARVRGRVLAGRAAMRSSGFRWPALVTVGALAALGGVVIGRATRRPPLSLPAPVPSARRLELASGAAAELGPSADVAVTASSPDRLGVVQRAGRARYDVAPDGPRAVEVRAGAVVTSVAGAVFTVDVNGPRVSVEVERGVIRVRDGASEHALVAGQTLTVPVVRATTPAAATTPPPSTAPVAPPPDRRTREGLELTLARVDALRRRGELSSAAESLERATQAHQGDPRLPSALFTLGRVQRARGLFADAARAFRRTWQIDPAGPLAADAHAQEARAWAAAQDRPATQQAARAYLQAQPHGPHADEMTRLLE